MSKLPKWDRVKWSDFTNDDRAKKTVRQFVSRSNEALEDSAGLFIFGTHGVGKSLLASLMIKELSSKHTTKVISLNGLTDLITGSWTDSSKKEEVNRLNQYYDFLIIEDFGKEFIKKDSERKSFITSILEDVINKRLVFKKSTTIVSSCGADKVSAQYSKYLSSIIKESCVPLKVTGGDYRDIIQDKLAKKYRYKQ